MDTKDLKKIRPFARTKFYFFSHKVGRGLTYLFTSIALTYLVAIIHAAPQPMTDGFLYRILLGFFITILCGISLVQSVRDKIKEDDAIDKQKFEEALGHDIAELAANSPQLQELKNQIHNLNKAERAKNPSPPPTRPSGEDVH